MRYFHPLDDLLSSRTKVRILRYLASHPGEHSGREVARAIEMGETPTLRTLGALSDTLTVILRSDGHTNWYRLNGDLALVQDLLITLFRSEESQMDNAVDWLFWGMDGDVQCVLVYGSAARGEESWASDLDLLVIVDTEGHLEPVRQELARRDLVFLRRYGVTSPQLVAIQDAVRQIRRGKAWIIEALTEGRIVWGDMPQELEGAMAA